MSTKGKQKEVEDPTLEQLGFKDEIKILVLGPQSKDIEELNKAQEEYERMRAPRSLHPSLLKGTKVSQSMFLLQISDCAADIPATHFSVQPRSTAKPTETIFHSLQVHPATSPNSPLHSKIHNYLVRLSTDPAIVHVCSLHSYQIGILTELLPHEHPNLLGLNENNGQRISLRIRTDDYESKGLRDYRTTRRVLIHELAHIEVNDHPVEFKELNSLLNKEVMEYEESVSLNCHSFLERDSFYEPMQDVSVDKGQTLAGGKTDQHKQRESNENYEREERRIRMLRAALRRVEEQESAIEVGCGTSTNKASKSSSSSSQQKK